VAWVDIDGRTTTQDDGTVFPALSAAPDLELFRAEFAASGIFVREETYTPDPASLVARFSGGDLTTQCTAGPVQPLANATMTGTYSTWTDCAGSPYDFYVVAANPIDGRQTSLLAFVQLADTEATALPVILSTLSLMPGV
jgi:hypothetical protein